MPWREADVMRATKGQAVQGVRATKGQVFRRLKVWARAGLGHGPRRWRFCWRARRGEPLKTELQAGAHGARGMRFGMPSWRSCHAHTFQGVGIGVVRTPSATAVHLLAR